MHSIIEYVTLSPIDERSKHGCGYLPANSVLYAYLSCHVLPPFCLCTSTTIAAVPPRSEVCHVWKHISILFGMSCLIHPSTARNMSRGVRLIGTVLKRTASPTTQNMLALSCLELGVLLHLASCSQPSKPMNCVRDCCYCPKRSDSSNLFGLLVSAPT